MPSNHLQNAIGEFLLVHRKVVNVLREEDLGAVETLAEENAACVKALLNSDIRGVGDLRALSDLKGAVDRAGADLKRMKEKVLGEIGDLRKRGSCVRAYQK